MSGSVGETDRELPVREQLPVEVVAAGLVCWLVPSGEIELFETRSCRRQQSLLNGSSDVEIVVDAIEVAFQLRFVQCSEDVVANLARDDCRYYAAAVNQNRVKQVDGHSAQRSLVFDSDR